MLGLDEISMEMLEAEAERRTNEQAAIAEAMAAAAPDRTSPDFNRQVGDSQKRNGDSTKEPTS